MSNKVSISGKIKSVEYSHEAFNENFYIITIMTERLSGTVDNIPVLVSERLHRFTNDEIGENISVTGEYRSHNEQKRLILYIWADSIKREEYGQDTNEIYMLGYLCKKPVYRKTPNGRYIADLMIASNRRYGKSDYIPCICWGRNAKYASDINIGENVEIIGRVQSREYFKENEARTAYEVSVSEINLVAGE